MSDIVHHRDKAADLWSKAADVADQKEVFLIHTISLVQLLCLTNKALSSRTVELTREISLTISTGRIKAPFAALHPS